MRRRALLQAAAVALLAGCAGGDDDPTDDESPGGTDGSPGTDSTTATTYRHTMVTETSPAETRTPTPTPEPTGTIEGSVISDGFSAERLLGEADPAEDTISVEGVIRNEAAETVTPNAALYDFLDASGTELDGARERFAISREVPPGATFEFDQTVAVEDADVTHIASMAVGIETET